MEKRQLPEVFPRRNAALEGINLVVSYQKTKELLAQMEAKVKSLTERASLSGARNFRNPREEADFLHRTKSLTVMTQQRNRLKDKLAELESRIRQEMEAAK